jgi:hypothetical protein
MTTSNASFVAPHASRSSKSNPWDDEAYYRRLCEVLLSPQAHQYLSAAQEEFRLENWYAATFHCTWLVKLELDSAKYRDAFNKAHAK